MYIVTNRITGQTSQHTTLKSASNKCDKLDLAYGAICSTYKYILK